MDLAQIVQRCEALHADTDFGYVSRWKARNDSKAVGFMPVYVPRELVHAAGMLPVGIIGAGEREIIKGDAYFQSYICRIPRSTIELGLLGKLDCLDGFLFPAICDVIRNLSGMWQTLFPNVYVKYLDLPQNFEATGRAYYRFELEQMKNDFEKLSGNTITDESLEHSIGLYNENRQAINAVYELRARAPHLVKTYELYLLLRASNILEVSEHTELLKRYLGCVERSNRPVRDHVRVVISGAFCEQPPLALIRALESSGCHIVDDDWVLGSRYLLRDIEPGHDPLGSLVNAYCGETVATASRHESASTKGLFLVEQVKQRRADGVLFAAPSFCDPALLERPLLQDVLSQYKIPYTGFKYSENTGQIQVIKEETGTFADSIRLWGEP